MEATRLWTSTRASLPSSQAWRYDSWVTVGAKNSDDNNLWTIGIDYNEFLAGQELTVTDGAWFVVPTDVQAAAATGNKVLLMQLTTDGTATGVLNLQGRDGEGGTWRAHDLTFNTENAQVFGCTDATAANFNTDATYNDGTCEGEASKACLASLLTLSGASSRTLCSRAPSA